MKKTVEKKVFTTKLKTKAMNTFKFYDDYCDHVKLEKIKYVDNTVMYVIEVWEEFVLEVENND